MLKLKSLIKETEYLKDDLIDFLKETKVDIKTQNNIKETVIKLLVQLDELESYYIKEKSVKVLSTVVNKFDKNKR